MTGAQGIASPDVNKAGCNTPVRDPVQQGRAQASPFSVFAADLSPITPSRTIGFASTWQPAVSPHLGDPSTIGGKRGGLTPSKQEQQQRTQSGDKSSLRSSFEAESTTFNYLYGAEPPARDSPAQQAEMNPANRDNRRSQCLVGVSGTDAELCRQSDRSEEPASLLVAQASGHKEGPGQGVASTDDCRRRAATVVADVRPPPRSPFAALAARIPPEEWAPSSQDEHDGNRRSGKRKSQGSEGPARQRRRTLTFPPPLPGQITEGEPPTQSGQSVSGTLLAQERLDSCVGELSELPSFTQTQAQQPLSSSPGDLDELPSFVQAQPRQLQAQQAMAQQPGKRLAVESASDTEDLQAYADDGQEGPSSRQQPPQPEGPNAQNSNAGATRAADPADCPLPSVRSANADPGRNRELDLLRANPALSAALSAPVNANREFSPDEKRRIAHLFGLTVTAGTGEPPVPRRYTGPGQEGQAYNAQMTKVLTGNQLGQAELEKSIAEGKPPARVRNDAGGVKRCNCKKSRCLKLYCDCFAAGQYCSNCTCTTCFNTAENSDGVLQMRESIRQRNPSAFDTKITRDQHKRGCHCKKSNCKKKYCECFQAGVNCGQQCKCEECHNQPENGPPNPKKNVPRNRDVARGVAREAAAAQKEALTASRRTSIRNKGKKTPAPVRAARLAEQVMEEDEEEDAPPYPTAKHSAASAIDGLPFSPPSLVWPSHPLHPASGVMQDGTVHNSEASLRHQSDSNRRARPMPVRGDGASTPLSLLHKAFTKDREKARQMSTSRQESGTLSGGVPAASRQLQRAENLTELVKDADEALVLSSLTGMPMNDGRATTSTGAQQQSGSTPPGNLPETFQMLSGDAGNGQYYPIRPQPRAVGRQGHGPPDYGYAPTYPSPQEPFADGPGKHEPHDDIRAQVLQAPYYQMDDQGDPSLGDLSYLAGAELANGEPLTEATPWTEHRVEDMEAGHAMEIQLDLMMEPSNSMEQQLGDHPFLLPSENEEGESPGQSSEDGDENAPPLQRIPHGMLALSKLDKADSFGFPQSSRAASSPASLHGRMPLSPSQGASNSRFASGHHHLGGRGSGHLGDDAQPGSNGLDSAPSFNPAGIPALRAHRTTALLPSAHSLGALPANGQLLEHRSHSGEMFQAVLQDTFPSIFEDGSGAEGGFSGGLEHAHSMPAYPGLSPHNTANFPPFQAPDPSVPLHRAFSCQDPTFSRSSYPYPPYASSDTALGTVDGNSQQVAPNEREQAAPHGHESQKRSPHRQLHRHVRTQSPRIPVRHSPQKSRFVRPPAAKPGSGFYRLTAGSTTIFSPPKQR